MIKKCLAITILLTSSFLLISCNNRAYPKPTDKFYINDFAEGFLPAVRATIHQEAERLNNFSTSEQEALGIQIVFASFLIEDSNEVASYNLSDLFNEWRIGKADLGVLVVFFFINAEERPIFDTVQVEVGYQLEETLSPIVMGRMIDETLLKAEDLQIGTIHLLYEMLSVIYGKYYDKNFNYNLEDTQYNIDNFVEIEAEDSLWDWMIFAITSPLSSWWGKGILGIILFIVFGGVGLGVKNLGSGGKSGGMGIRRRK